MRRFIFLFSLTLVLAFTACSGNQPQPVTTDDKGEASSSQVKPASQQAGSTTGNPGGAPPAHGGAPAGSPEKPAELVELEKAYEKSPSDEATKKKLVNATYEYGKKLNYDPALPPKVKYPEALRMFRRALELDPSHKDALAEKDQIEGIYKQMGRPIPQ